MCGACEKINAKNVISKIPLKALVLIKLRVLEMAVFLKGTHTTLRDSGMCILYSDGDFVRLVHSSSAIM